MDIGAFRELPAETPQKLLYRPSVDTIIRQYTGNGLADFELVAKEKWTSSTRNLYQINPWRQKHETLRYRLMNVTQSLYTYLGEVCNEGGTVSEEEAIKPYSVLCKRLQMSGDDLSQILDSWYTTPSYCPPNLALTLTHRFQMTETLDVTTISTLYWRIGPNIIPILFPEPFTYNDTIRKSPQATVDSYIVSGFSQLTVDVFLSTEEVPQRLIIFDALRLVIGLLDVNAEHHTVDPFGGANVQLIETVKRYHRRAINADLASGDIMNMSLPNAQPTFCNQHGRPINRGIIALRQKLGLSAFPPEVTDYVRFDPHDTTTTNLICNPSVALPSMSKDEKIHAVHNAYMQAEKKENEMLPYFNKICIEACTKCPVTGDNLPKSGLEELLEHVRVMHQDVFWYGAIWLLA